MFNSIFQSNSDYKRTTELNKIVYHYTHHGNHFEFINMLTKELVSIVNHILVDFSSQKPILVSITVKTAFLLIKIDCKLFHVFSP